MSTASGESSEIASPGAARKASPPKISPAAASGACRELLGVEPSRIDYPGGNARCSVRALAGNTSWIVTRRPRPARAALEAGVLRELRAAGAPVPSVIAFDGDWLIQQDLGDRRLTSALGGADRRASGDWAARAVVALLLCQRAAEKLDLAKRVAPIGISEQWLSVLLSAPAGVAAQLDLADPDVAAVVAPEQLLPRRFAFVKWDARPGNALQVGDDGLAWIDWEHCGTRDALDDLAWLLADEYMPDDARLESALLKRYLPLFARLSGRSTDDALVYLSRFGSLHAGVRLALVLRHKGDGDWWDAADCERTDRIGVTAAGARRLCTRGARWAKRFPGGERLAKFFSDADLRLREGSAGAAPSGSRFRAGYLQESFSSRSA